MFFLSDPDHCRYFMSFSMRLTSVSSLQLHPLLCYLRERGARCVEAAVQNRSTEGRRGQRQSPQTQNSRMMWDSDVNCFPRVVGSCLVLHTMEKRRRWMTPRWPSGRLGTWMILLFFSLSFVIKIVLKMDIGHTFCFPWFIGENCIYSTAEWDTETFLSVTTTFILV